MLTYLFILFLLFAVAWPLLRFTVYAISNHLAGELGEVREKLGGSLAWPMIRGAVTAMLAECIAVPSYFFAPLISDDDAGPGMPVLLVHGLYHNRTAWWLLRLRLKRAGFTNIHTYQYTSFLTSFDEVVAGAEARLNALLGNDPDARVMLVGHSLGGCVCRAAAANPAYSDRIACLVALGSPHKGADLARFATNRLGRDLIPGGVVARRLESLPDPGCPRLAIYHPVDDFVFPLSMLRPNRPDWDERLCSPMGHVWMLYSGEVAGEVIAFMKRMREPGAS